MGKTGNDSGPNVRHSRYTIVEVTIPCPKCTKVTAAFALPAGHESLNPADDMPENVSDAWETTEFASVLSYVEYLPDSVINRVVTLTVHYRLESDPDGSNRYWKNHCEHCHGIIGEELLHEDLDSPFGTGTSAPIQLHHVREPFEALVGAESFEVKILDG